MSRVIYDRNFNAHSNFVSILYDKFLVLLIVRQQQNRNGDANGE